MVRKVDFKKNVPNWHVTDKDYCLVFLPLDDNQWHECSHNLPQYSNILLADYLAEMNITIPDWTQFIRIIDEERGLCFEYRTYGARVVIYVMYK